MTDVQAVAKDIIYKLGHRDTDWKCCISDDAAITIISAAIAAALDAREREVYKKVAEYIADEINSDRDCRPQTISVWCRRQGGGG